jgi:beta-lactam-binding protein with PASTA domain
VRYQPDDSATAGTVLATDPQAGVMVPAGTQVTIVVATRPVPSEDGPSQSGDAAGNDG